MSSGLDAQPAYAVVYHLLCTVRTFGVGCFVSLPLAAYLLLCFDVELSTFGSSGSWVFTDICFMERESLASDAHDIVNAGHCLFTSLLGVGVPNQGAGDNISVSNPFDDVAPGQSQRPNSYGPPYGHTGGPPRPQGTSLLACLLTPLMHISCHLNCSHVHLSFVFSTLVCRELLLLCSCAGLCEVFSLAVCVAEVLS